MALFVAAAFVMVGCGEDSASEGTDASGGAGTETDSAGNGPEIEAHDFSVAAEPGSARAGRIEEVSGLVSGPKMEGRLGDIRIDNAQVAFVLEDVRRSSGYSYWGGNVTDAAARRADGTWAPDHFGEAFFGWNLDLFKPETVEIVDDGRVSGTAHVRYVGSTVLFHFADSVIADFLNLDPPELDLVYDYTLGPDDGVLTLTVTFQNTRNEPVLMDWPVVFTHFGDGVFPYGPERGFNESSGLYIPYLGLAGREVAYGVVSDHDDLTSFFTYAGVSLVQVDAIEVLPLSELSRNFYFLVSAVGPAGLDHGRREALGHLGDGSQPLTGTVDLPSSASSEETWVAVRQAADDVLVTVLAVDADGDFTVELLEGDYTLTAYAEHHTPSPAVSASVPPAADGGTVLEIPLAAQVRVSVSEATSGQATPARVTFVRSGTTPSAYAPSQVRPAQKTWGGNESAVAYVTGSDELVTLPVGTYQVTASRGPTHEIDQRLLTFEAGEPTDLEMTVEQVIDTTGWLSGDFHIHAWWSPDSYVPWSIRARQAATEDLDLPILTEHVYIGSLQRDVEEQGVGDHVIGITGQEVTSFTHGHFNAFPLEWRDDEPNRGAVFPYDKDPVALFEAIRNQHADDEVVQINHPRGSNMGSYFSYVGLDAANDTVANPAHWSTDWDAIEVFNGGCGGSQVVDDWIGLTNHGHRKTLASGSDSHGEDGLIGTPRNWIQVDEASVRADSQALVAPIRQRRLFVSCGPFVRFEAVDTGGDTVAAMGEMTGVDGQGNVMFHVIVEAPTWITLDEVRLWENGQVIQVADITTAADPILRFDEVWTVTPMADAWYAVEVIGSGSMAPVTWSGPPYALTNPIEVDADGDGEWTPPGSP